MERVPTTRPLTTMQLVIATLLGVGQTHQEVADTLTISVAGVREHLDRIARKIPGDLPREQKVVAWVRGASEDVLLGKTLRFEMMLGAEAAAARLAKFEDTMHSARSVAEERRNVTSPLAAASPSEVP